MKKSRSSHNDDLKRKRGSLAGSNGNSFILIYFFDYFVIASWSPGGRRIWKRAR